MRAELSELESGQDHLEQDHQAAADHLQLVQSAMRQQEKIQRYEEDLLELSERLEEQIMVVEEATEQLTEAELRAAQSEEEVDSLKNAIGGLSASTEYSANTLFAIPASGNRAGNSKTPH